MAAQDGLLSRLYYRLATSARKKLHLGHALGELEPYLAQKDLVFQAPLLSPELVAAIKLISPQFHLSTDERSRRFWELNQNGLCWGEFEALAPVLEARPTPQKVLDIGPGMGRSTIFFKKKMGWQDVSYHLYESSGETTNYTKAGPRFDDSFCGSPDHLQNLLAFNRIENIEIFDAADLEARLDRLPGPYDFIYSFFAVGFHWSLEHFLPEILQLMHENSIGAFTLHPRFDRFDRIQGVPYRVVPFRRSWPRGRWSDLLVLSKNPQLLEVLPETQ
ncbi:MAG: hypothetical protein AAF657_30165 [Acidobacteriota bacterium]